MGAAALALLTSSCGDAGVPGAARTTSTASRSKERAGGDRSLLSLLPSAERFGRGAFQIRAPEDLEQSHLAANVNGWFWTTKDGLFTRVDIDRDLVDGHVDAVLARPKRQEVDPAASDLIYLNDDYYRGDEFQFGVGRLLARIGLGFQPDQRITDGMVKGCRSALAALDAAASEQAAALEPRFEPSGDGEVWEFPLDELRRRTTTERARIADICTTETRDNEFAPRPRVLFQRVGGRLDVIVDQGIRTDPPVEVRALTVLVEAAVAVPDPPGAPDPADGFDPVNGFILTIGECGGLPWEYSNFAAGNTYGAPEADDYIGPTAFSTDYLCESEVPEGER